MVRAWGQNHPGPLKSAGLMSCKQAQKAAIHPIIIRPYLRGPCAGGAFGRVGLRVQG